MVEWRGSWWRLRKYGTGRVLWSENSSVVFHIPIGDIFEVDNGIGGDIIRDDVSFVRRAKESARKIMDLM